MSPEQVRLRCRESFTLKTPTQLRREEALREQAEVELRLIQEKRLEQEASRAKTRESAMAGRDLLRKLELEIERRFGLRKSEFGLSDVLRNVSTERMLAFSQVCDPKGEGLDFGLDTAEVDENFLESFVWPLKTNTGFARREIEGPVEDELLGEELPYDTIVLFKGNKWGSFDTLGYLKPLLKQEYLASHSLVCKVYILAASGIIPPGGSSECESYLWAMGRPEPVLPSANKEVIQARLVIWKTRGVPPPEDEEASHQIVGGHHRTDSNVDIDLFTDTHYGSLDGTATFNWRMLFDMEVPCHDPVVKLQLYHNPLLGQKVALGEATLDLVHDTLRCRRTRRAVELPRGQIPLSNPAYPGQSRGMIDCQMKLLPIEEAHAMPVGSGRDVPNRDPYLDPEDSHLREHRSALGNTAFVRQAKALGESLMKGELHASLNELDTPDVSKLHPVIQRLQGKWFGLPSGAEIVTEGSRVTFNGAPLLGRLSRHSDGKVTLLQWVSYPEKEEKEDELTWFVNTRNGPVMSTQWVRSLPDSKSMSSNSPKKATRKSSSSMLSLPPLVGGSKSVSNTNALMDSRKYSSGVTARLSTSSSSTRWTLCAVGEMFWLKEFIERVLIAIGAAIAVERLGQAWISRNDSEFFVWHVCTTVHRVRASGVGVEDQICGPQVSGRIRRQIDGQIERAEILLCWKSDDFPCRRLRVRAERNGGKLSFIVYDYELSWRTLDTWQRGEATLGDGFTLSIMKPKSEVAEAVHGAIQRNSSHLGRYLSGLVEDCRTVERTWWLLLRWYQDHFDGDGVHFGLFDRNGAFLGVVEIDRRPLRDEIVGVVEYWLTRDACGQGLAQRMFQEAMRYAVQMLGITSFHLDIHPDNKGSAATAIRSGAKQMKSRREQRGQGGRYAMASTQMFDVYKINADSMGVACGGVGGNRGQWMESWIETKAANAKETLKDLKNSSLHLAGALTKSEEVFRNFGLNARDPRLRSAKEFMDQKRLITEVQNELHDVRKRIAKDQESIDQLETRGQRLTEQLSGARERMKEFKGRDNHDDNDITEMKPVERELATYEENIRLTFHNITELRKRLLVSKQKEERLKSTIESPQTFTVPDESLQRAVTALDGVELLQEKLEKTKLMVEEQAAILEDLMAFRGALKDATKLTSTCMITYSAIRRQDCRSRARSEIRSAKLTTGSNKRSQSAHRQWYFPDVPRRITLGDWYHSLDIPVVGENVLMSCLQRDNRTTNKTFWAVLIVSSSQQQCQESRWEWFEFIKKLKDGALQPMQVNCSVLDLTNASHDSRETLAEWLELDLFNLPQLRIIYEQQRFVYQGSARVDELSKFLSNLPSPITCEIPKASKDLASGRLLAPMDNRRFHSSR